jgi:hypothetical protein
VLRNKEIVLEETDENVKPRCSQIEPLYWIHALDEAVRVVCSSRRRNVPCTRQEGGMKRLHFFMIHSTCDRANCQSRSIQDELSFAFLCEITVLNLGLCLLHKLGNSLGYNLPQTLFAIKSSFLNPGVTHMYLDPQVAFTYWIIVDNDLRSALQCNIFQLLLLSGSYGTGIASMHQDNSTILMSAT